MTVTNDRPPTARPNALFLKADDGYRTASFDELITAARNALVERFVPGVSLASPALAKDYLRMTLATLEHESFVMLTLDSQNRLISSIEIARGGLNAANVYSREVVKKALAANCAAVIFAHNHPSGTPEPSDADRVLTRRLSEALALVDVRVMDHLVIGGNEIVSFAQRGWV